TGHCLLAGIERNRSGSAWRLCVTSSCALEISRRVSVSALRSESICRRRSRGRLSSPRNGTTIRPVPRIAAANFKNGCCIGSPPVNGHISYRDPLIHADDERLALRLPHGHQAFPVFFAELPVIKPCLLRLIVALRGGIGALPVEPDRIVELERVGRILAFVHLREVVLAEAEIV